MSSRHHIDDFMRGRIIGKIKEGRKITAVAREFDIAHSVVSRLWKSFKTTGMWVDGTGRSSQQVANQFLAASGKQISRKTVVIHLRGGGLYPCRPVVCVPLIRQHRTARLQWCRASQLTEQDGHAYYSQMREKDRYPSCSIMVWAGIMINGRTRLHVVANGTMTGQQYNNEVLLPHVRLFRGAVGDKFVFFGRQRNMSSNTPCSELSRQRGQVAGRNYPPTNKNTLIRALTEEWDKLPQQLLDNVVRSMV
ncbi:transposable element Tcb1 transposase [Trichonephila clavipes]|nr:transposable element Tcb1 transposase [Trichonephila clavipes]